MYVKKIITKRYVLKKKHSTTSIKEEKYVGKQFFLNFLIKKNFLTFQKSYYAKG